MEDFKKIEDYDKYSISNFGRVRNDTTGKILKNNLHPSGYHLVSLCNGRSISK